METSIYLAKLLGPIYLVVATGMLLNADNIRAVAKEIAASPAHSYLTGIMALVAGGFILLLHNVWTGWPLVITLLGCAAILKGVVRLLMPAQSSAWIKDFASNSNTMTGTALAALALGAYLTAMGFWIGPLG